MKYLKFIIIPIIALMIGLTISCERDDICPESTQTTPNLLIDFLDFENSENGKNVQNLVIADMEGNVLEALSQTASISIPLRTVNPDNGELATSTQYVLHSDYSFDDNDTPNDTSDDIIGGNQDIITIDYTTELVFVSRACGYKTIYSNVRITIEADSDNWILSRQSANDNQPIEDETTTHFNLLH